SSRSNGHREDESGPALARFVEDLGAEVAASEIVPDDQGKIEWALRHYSDTECCDLVLTTGGTGFAPDDVTPEATKAVIERDAPGFAEAMRAESLKFTPMGILTRGVSGIAGPTLIVNFPRNPKSIGQLFPVIAPTLQHAVASP